MKPEDIIQRHDALRATRAPWESVWQEIADYCLPGKADFSTQNNPGAKRTHKIFDSTAVHALSILAASLHGSLTSPSTQWFNLRFRDEALNEDDSATEWLEDCGNRINQALAESTFNSEINELYLDLSAFGTAALMVEDRDGRLNFRAVHLSEAVFAEDPDGLPESVFRVFKYSARQIVARWGSEVAGDKVRECLEKEPDRPFEIIHALTPREGVKASAEPTVPDQRPIASQYILKDGLRVLEDGGYYELPMLVPRWAKLAGDSYGFSPAMVAMPDIKTLNRAKRLTFTAWEKAIDPPMLATERGIIGDLRLTPGGLTTVRDINGIKAMESAARWDVNNIQVDHLQASIRQSFFADQLELKESPTMTATEVQIRYELMQRLLGPTLGRLQSELLNPLVKRVFYILARAGKLAPVPDALSQQAANVDVEYVGPLARAQKMDDVMALQRFAEMAAQAGQFDPQAVDIIDVDGGLRMAARRLGVPAKALRSTDQVEEIRAQRAQAQQQQMQLEQASQGIGMAGQAADVAQKMGMIPQPETEGV